MARQYTGSSKTNAAKEEANLEFRLKKLMKQETIF